MASIRSVYNFSAGLEIVSGVGIIAIPKISMDSLFSTSFSDPISAIARLYGFALFGLGIACLEQHTDRLTVTHTRQGLCVYNITAALVLINAGAGGTANTLLLIPAGILHLILGIIMAIHLFKATYKS